MDLSTTYLGLSLRNPVVAAPSPLQQTTDGLIGLVDAGVGAVVLHSIFEEQIRQDRGEDPGGHDEHHFRNPAGPGGPRRYLDLIADASSRVDVPVIGSINGRTDGDWVSFAGEMAEAGAAAVEFNFYAVPGHLQMPGSAVEERVVSVFRAIRACVDVPVAVKLPPYFSSLGDVALRLVEHEADGLVFFNRFLQPSIDPATLAVQPVIDLSHRAEARLPQTWIALLRDHLQVSLAGTGGVESADDVAAYLLAGADVVQCASAFLRHGRDYAGELLRGLEAWGDQHGFASVADVRGRLAVPWDVDRDDYDREGYVAALQTARQTYLHR